jgi:hypothetical protein
VLDTNVLISAFVFPGGALEHVYRRVLDGQAMLSGDRHLRGLGSWRGIRIVEPGGVHG